MNLRPASEERRDDVVAVPVEVVPGPVVMRRRPGIGMPGAMSLAEQILRKLLVPEKEYEQHYVDLEMGVFDCRVDLTDEEIAYCRALNDGADDA